VVRNTEINTISHSERSSAHVGERIAIIIYTNTRLLRPHRTIFSHSTAWRSQHRHLDRLFQNQNHGPQSHPRIQVFFTSHLPLLTCSLEKIFDVHDFAKQTVLLDKNLIAILADDDGSSSLVKVIRHNEKQDEIEEICCTRDLGKIIRIFPQSNGTGLFCETSQGIIYDLGGDQTDPQLMAPAFMAKFPSRCHWTGFASVDGHVTLPSSPFPFHLLSWGLICGGYDVWLNGEWQVVCQQSTFISRSKYTSPDDVMHFISPDPNSPPVHNTNSPQINPSRPLHRRPHPPISYGF